MDIMQAVTFIPEEDHWIEKLAIGMGVILVSSVLSIVLVGVLGFFIVGGYSIRLLQNVRDGRHPVLPEWNDWGGDLTRGFKYAVMVLVWGLAAFLLYIPIFMGVAMSGGDNGFIQFVGASLMAVGLCLAMLYGIFFFLAQPGFTIAFATDEHIHSGLQLSKIWHWTRANLGQVIIVAIAVFIGSFIISTLGSLVGAILCIVGLVVTVPLAILVTSIFQFHLFGQLAREFPMDGSRPASVDEPAPDEPDSEPVGLIETEQTLDTDEASAESEEPASAEEEAPDVEEPTSPEEEIRDVWAEPEESTPPEEEARDVWAEPEESTSPEEEPPRGVESDESTSSEDEASKF
jgi:hypothetical protein